MLSKIAIQTTEKKTLDPVSQSEKLCHALSGFYSAVKRLIASEIKVFVYIIYVCVLCIL